MPASLSAELKFQIARRVVGAEIQYITYHEFLPAMGVKLSAYTGYKPTVDPTESNEFATVGFRAHSMVHGEMEPSAPRGHVERRAACVLRGARDRGRARRGHGDAGRAPQPGFRRSGLLEEDAVAGVRATSLASRLKAVYGRQSAVDAFTDMVSERHVAGSDLGPLQQAIWKRQFEDSRDGDRFFYLNDPALPLIQQPFGISARRSLAQVIRANTGAAVQDDVFKVPAE